MIWDELIALSIFFSYFLLILSLFGLIYRSQRHNIRIAYTVKDVDILTFTTLTVISFAHTWFYMIKFLAWSFVKYESSVSTPASPDVLSRVTAWLMNTDLFEQAWATVCRGAFNWWWSEQLCIFTVGFWTVFIYMRGKEYSVPLLWAYMLLGQLVAISVASNMFYLALVLSRRTKKDIQSKAPLDLWITVLASLSLVARSPYTTDQDFLTNLLGMHTLIIVPLLPWPESWRAPCNLGNGTLYTGIALAGLGMRLATTISAAKTIRTDKSTSIAFLQEALVVLHSHPAQSSIGWDVVWTIISFIVWLALAPLHRLSISERLPQIPHLNKLSQ